MIPYRKGLKERAKELRSQSTPAEIILWNYLKDKQLGVDFDRQKPMLGFIVDFYCKSLRLAIEVDGSSHDGKKDYDQAKNESYPTLWSTFFTIYQR
jgi:very-short-patch-repair endonuclease